MHVCGSSWRQDRKTDKHTYAHGQKTHRQHPHSCAEAGCGEEDATLIWEMLQILISTHVLYLIYLITIIIIIILIISNNYPLKLNKTSVQLRGSNPYRIVQQLATVKLCVWMREKRNVWKKKKLRRRRGTLDQLPRSWTKRSTTSGLPTACACEATEKLF